MENPEMASSELRSHRRRRWHRYGNMDHRRACQVPTLNICLNPPRCNLPTSFLLHFCSGASLHFHGELLQVQVVRHVAVDSLADASRGLGPVHFTPFGVEFLFGFRRVL